MMTRAVNYKEMAHTNVYKIACVGDSITRGFGLPNPNDSYPAILQRLIGERFLVRNFGVDGATVRRNIPCSYAITEECENALEWNPDFVVLQLGANDILHILGQGEIFILDYKCIIEAFMSQGAQICLASLTPVLRVYGLNDNELARRYQKIQELIGQLAKTYSLPLIDIWTPINIALSSQPSILQDGIHPSEIGAKILASSIYRTIEPLITATRKDDI